LGSTWMGSAASVCTCVIAQSTVVHTLVGKLSALIVWNGLGILRNVGSDAIGTDTAPVECLWVAVVRCSGGSVGLLEAEQRAGGLLIAAPCVSQSNCDTIWIDGLGANDGDEEGNGGEETHYD